MNNVAAGIGLIVGGWIFNRSADKYSADEEDYPPANPLRIIIGGPPHSGKSTLMNLLEDKFQEYGVSVELRDLDLASKTDLKGGFDINREKKKWNKELADEAAALFEEPSDGRVILGDSIGLVSQLNEIVSEPADVAILLVGGSYGDNDDEYRSQLSKWNRYYDTIDKPVLMVIRSSMNPNDDNYFDPADNYGVIVGLDRPTYQQREEEGKRKGERKISLENACLEGMVFEIAQAYDLRLKNQITPAHKENIKRVWPTIQSHRGSPKNPVFVNIENEYYNEKGWNAESFGRYGGRSYYDEHRVIGDNEKCDFTEHNWIVSKEPFMEGHTNLSIELICKNCGVRMNVLADKKQASKMIQYGLDGGDYRAAESFKGEKKNCGCGKDPCVTYGVDTFEARSRGGKSLLKRQEKLLKQYRQDGGNAFYYERLPSTLQEDLKRIKFHETLHHAVSRWLGDNPPPTFSRYAETEVFNASMYNCPDCGFAGYQEEFLDAEDFEAKIAPPLESYTKDELISSMAGPQGSASYDEMVFDPVSQNRLSAEER